MPSSSAFHKKPIDEIIQDLSDTHTVTKKTPTEQRTRKTVELNQFETIFTIRTNNYHKLFVAICTYVFMVMVILWGNTSYFKLSDAVLITLLSTTTTNVLFGFYIASNWLYPPTAKNKKFFKQKK